LQPLKQDIEFNDTLLESIDQTITDLLGPNVVDALYTHLQTTYSISREEVPHRLDTLSAVLKRIFGGSSLTVSKAIARKFYLKLGLELTVNQNHTLLEYVNDAKMKLQISQSK
jgi:hypothetical protein